MQKCRLPDKLGSCHLLSNEPFIHRQLKKIVLSMYVIGHYCDVITGAMSSQITSLAIVYSTVYSGADQINIKAPRHWPLRGEFTGDRWIPRTKGQ